MTPPRKLAKILFHNHVKNCKSCKSETFSRATDNHTWKTEWTTAALAKVQLCEYENQTMEAFVAANRLSAKLDCPVPPRMILKLVNEHVASSPDKNAAPVSSPSISQTFQFRIGHTQASDTQTTSKT